MRDDTHDDNRPVANPPRAVRVCYKPAN